MNKKIIKYLRSDHAGELGAVYIYVGILKTTKCPKIKTFANTHLITERKHLKEIERILPRINRSKCLSIWKISGFLLGAICGLVGPSWVYASIERVETFVEKHYQEQIDYLKNLEIRYSEILTLLIKCQEDEISHKIEAAESVIKADNSYILNYWLWLIDWGSSQVVKIAKAF